MQWFYGIGNEVGGPVENDELVTLVRSGQIRPETPVWSSYLGNWTPAARIDGLFAAAGFSSTPGCAPGCAPVLATVGNAPRDEHVERTAGSDPTALVATAAGLTTGGKPVSPNGATSPVAIPESGGVEHGTGAALNTAGVALNEAGVTPTPVSAAGAEEKGACESQVLNRQVGVESHPMPTSPQPTPHGGVALNPHGIPLPGSANQGMVPRGAAVDSSPAGGAGGPVGGGEPLPRVETSKLGLTAIQRSRPVVPGNPEGVVLNTAGVALAPREATGKLMPDARDGSEGPASIPQDQPSGTGVAGLNPNGIPLPGSATPEASPVEEAFDASGLAEPDEVGSRLPDFPGVATASPMSVFAPVRRMDDRSPGAGGWKKWVFPGLAAMVLLAGGAALADRLLLGGKLFGFGARPTGAYRYYPDAPRFALNVKVRDLLLHPVVAGKLEAGGGMSMIDQMMQSAVGLRPYDIKDIQVLGTDFSMDAPHFICIVTTTKKIPEELLVEKLFGEGKPERVRGCNIYELPMMGRKNAVACVADENSFLIGGRDEIISVLSRTAEPEFTEGELTMVGAATDSPAILSVCFDGEMIGRLAKLQDSLPSPAAPGHGNLYSKEFMAAAKSVAVSMDLTDDFEIDYRVGFDSDSSAESALGEMKHDFEEMGEEGFAAQMASGGTDPGMVDAKILRQIMDAVEFSQDGSTAVVHMGIPLDFFEKIIGKSMGAAAPF